MPLKTTEQFIKDARRAHGDKYDYSMAVYKNRMTPVSIVCNKHGVFRQKPANHLEKRGCPKCGIECRSYPGIDPDTYNALTELAVDNLLEVPQEYTVNQMHALIRSWERKHKKFWIRLTRVGDKRYFIKGDY